MKKIFKNLLKGCKEDEAETLHAFPLTYKTKSGKLQFLPFRLKSVRP